jgi:tetratricopeptide (TPR) repeat protein
MRNTSKARKKPTDARLDGLINEALALKDKEDYRGAIAILSAAVKEYPVSAPVHGLLGDMYFCGLRQPAKAIPHYEKATQLAPKSERASLGLFHSLWKLDKVVEALEEMKRFQTISHSNDYAEILAEILEKLDEDEPSSVTEAGHNASKRRSSSARKPRTTKN